MFFYFFVLHYIGVFFHGRTHTATNKFNKPVPSIRSSLVIYTSRNGSLIQMANHVNRMISLSIYFQAQIKKKSTQASRKRASGKYFQKQIKKTTQASGKKGRTYKWSAIVRVGQRECMSVCVGACDQLTNVFFQCAQSVNLKHAADIDLLRYSISKRLMRWENSDQLCVCVEEIPVSVSV